MTRPFDPSLCPDCCEHRRRALDEPPAEAIKAVECPLQMSRGLWGWPCHSTMAEVIAREQRLSGANVLATLAG